MMRSRGLFGTLPASLVAAMLMNLVPVTARADINPWVPAGQYDPAIWDSAGPRAATPWLHPNAWTPHQDWGWFSGNSTAPNIAGSWGGLRDQMELQGLTFQATYLGQLAANPVGGAKSGGTSWIGDWSLSTFLDLERLLETDQPAYFAASVNLKTGNTGLSPGFIGNQFAVQLSSSSSPGLHFSLVELALGVQIFDNNAEIVGGRLLTGNDFATVSQACSSLNQAICGNPIAGASSVNFPTYPNAVWGARVKVKPQDSWYAQAGAYLVYPDLGDPDLHGVEFGAPDGSGILAIGEAGYHVGSRADKYGLPGTYKIGGYFDTEELTNLSSGASQRNTWGLYAMGEQMLYSDSSNYASGLWGWLALSYAPPDLNEITFMASGGLTFAGPFVNRPDDSVSLIMAAGLFSNRLAGQNVETILELNYRAQVLPAVFFQPDIQLVIDPDGKSTADDALVIGFAMGATF